MSILYDFITASNIAGYYNTKNQNVDATLGQELFPAKKQLGLKLGFVKGAAGKAVVLKPAAFDTKVALRERIGVSMTEEEMPFFKEAMLVKEADRQQLNMLASSGQSAYVDTIVNGVFNDELTLISGAHARLEAMRMQVLATGKIAVNANGVAKDIDYGVQQDHKAKAAKAWTEADATPLADIEKAIDAMGDLGLTPEVMIVNSKTLSQARKAESTVKLIKPLAPKGASVTKAEFLTYLESEFGISVEVKDGTYVGDDGKAVKFFPDGYVTFAPQGALGSTVFGTTPEESDLLGASNVNADVAVVDNGITITTTKETDPVNVQTKVSMVALPSFERLNEVYMLDAGVPVV